MTWLLPPDRLRSLEGWRGVFLRVIELHVVAEQDRVGD